MAADRFTEVTSRSWFGRIGGAIKGVIVGVLLFAVAFPVLFLNEGRSVKTYKRIKEAGGAVVSVAADVVSPENAQKLIHVTGKAITSSSLSDPLFNLTVSALKLKRSVEMFQWKESTSETTKKKVGGGEETVTTYNYAKEWSSRLINSSSFKQREGHQNPNAMPFNADSWTAASITVGAFTLSPSLAADINNFEPLLIPSELELPGEFANRIVREATGLYVGANPASPSVGDTRISFHVANPTDVSIISRQIGNTFEPYQSKVGGTFERLQLGIHSAETMIEQAKAENKMLTWILRLVGFILMLVGLMMVFKPMSVLADVIPVLGSIVGAGTGMVAFLLAACFSITTVAIAWVVYRPILGIGLLVVAGGAIFMTASKLKKAKATQVAAS